MSAGGLSWYARRLGRMSPAEVGSRVAQHAHRTRWRHRWSALLAEPADHLLADDARRFTAVLPAAAGELLGDELGKGVIEAAEAVLAGEWEILGVRRRDSPDPDWFHDPVTGVRAPSRPFAFSIDHRSEEVTGNVKQLWDLSRMHHLTVLAAAFSVTGDERYAAAVDGQLRSWWAQNPFLSGVHWVSGIEVGMRLVAWAWIRRLLEGWEGAAGLFERNPDALAQLWWHQRYLDAFPSRGSSANNHLVAEQAGQLVAALAFPWFDRSAAWAGRAAEGLADALEANTFPSGLNRELASEYHLFVGELGLLAGVEADAAGRPLPEKTWRLLGRMLDALAGVVDETGRPPRQGDGDSARGLVVSATDDPVATLLDIGRRLVGGAVWWPPTAPSATGMLVASLGSARNRNVPAWRSSHFSDAGFTILRTRPADGPEIWCRCDGGPHGFLTIAAHAHADALAVEVRHGGVDVLADPGTYCYHGEEEFRSYFRSTLGHNTVELAGTSQAVSGGPFLWTRHTESRVLRWSAGAGPVQSWEAEHDGYRALDPPAVHRRSVRLDAVARELRITDLVRTAGPHPLRVAFHLGPTVDAELVGHRASLTWRTARGWWAGARLVLPRALTWTAVRGSTSPVLGWYSPSFGTRVPATTLVGVGTADVRIGELVTILRFVDCIVPADQSA